MAIIPQLLVFLTAMLPISEVRGALPLGINVYGLPAWQVFLLACAGNMLIVPILLVALKHFIKNTKLQKWAQKRSETIDRYGKAGLMAFVAIPLPVTGAWTASLVAVFLGMSLKKALLSIYAGILIAAMIVTVFCLMGWLGAILAGFILIFIAFSWLQKRSIYA